MALIAAWTTSAASTKPLQAGSAHWALQGRVITFSGWYRRDQENARLWVMNADGTHRRPISSRGTGVFATLGTASLSPDGSTVAETYDTGNAGLLILRRPGGKVTREFALRVRSGEYYGPTAWAPDSRAIAVQVATTNRSVIFVADLRAGVVRSISRTGSRDETGPAWSPDGRRIAFVTCSGGCHLGVMGQDGGQRRLLTRKTVTVGIASPAWSPDGQMIALAFPFGPEGASRTIPAPQRWGVYVFRADGSKSWRIAATPMMQSGGLFFAWSPDSRRIAFSEQRGIYVADLGGSKRLITPLGRESDLGWSPSSRIVFTHAGDIYSVFPGERPLRILR